MNGQEFREAIATAASSCDGHVTHGSLDAVVRVFDEQMVLVGNTYATKIRELNARIVELYGDER